MGAQSAAVMAGDLVVGGMKLTLEHHFPRKYK
jgi:hypothetical protein